MKRLNIRELPFGRRFLVLVVPLFAIVYVPLVIWHGVFSHEEGWGFLARDLVVALCNGIVTALIFAAAWNQPNFRGPTRPE